MNKKQQRKGSAKARMTAARLSAVQALYQMDLNEQSAGDTIAEFARHRLGKTLDETDMVLPDGVLFKNIVAGVQERRADLETIVNTALQKSRRAQTGSVAPMDPLILDILYCGAYELMAHHEVDAPIIIADYLNITHAFYDQGEAKLVNGVLDTVSKAVRDES